jgi:hypothetical protein
MNALLRGEAWFRLLVLKHPHLKVSLTVGLPAVLVVTYFLPQIITDTSSFEAARAACHDRYIVLALKGGSKDYAFDEVVDIETAEANYQAFADLDLYPSHVFRTVQAVVPLVCLCASWHGCS